MKFFNIWARSALCLACLCSEATALTRYADATVRVDSFSCEVVRFYVARYGVAATERWAKKNKWPKDKIEAARICMAR